MQFERDRECKAPSTLQGISLLSHRVYEEVGVRVRESFRVGDGEVKPYTELAKLFNGETLLSEDAASKVESSDADSETRTPAAPYKVKLGAENKRVLQESKDSKRMMREEKRHKKSEERMKVERVQRVQAGAKEERLCCSNCGEVFMHKGRLELHVRREICQNTPKRLDRAYATADDLHRAWFGPVPSSTTTTSATPSNTLTFEEEDEREWPPADPLLWKIGELQACCRHVGALCAGSKEALVARLQGKPDPRMPPSTATTTSATQVATGQQATSATTQSVDTATPVTIAAVARSHTNPSEGLVGSDVPATPPARSDEDIAVERILKGVQPSKVTQLERGWARKVEGAQPRPPKVIMERRLAWIKAYYDKVVGKGHRANEYVAAREMRNEHLDEDDMWLPPSSLKSAFAKLTKVRKAREAQLNRRPDGATPEGATAVDDAATAATAGLDELTPEDLEHHQDNVGDDDDQEAAGTGCVVQ